jgi:hypothetical protein
MDQSLEQRFEEVYDQLRMLAGEASMLEDSQRRNMLLDRIEQNMDRMVEAKRQYNLNVEVY